MQELEKILKAMADKNRLRILKLLQRREMCVCELASVIGIAQPSVSRHLKKLVNAGLIAPLQDGLWSNYKLIKVNGYGKTLLNDLAKWINADQLITKDKEKVKNINRAILCNK